MAFKFQILTFKFLLHGILGEKKCTLLLEKEDNGGSGDFECQKYIKNLKENNGVLVGVCELGEKWNDPMTSFVIISLLFLTSLCICHLFLCSSWLRDSLIMRSVLSI